MTFGHTQWRPDEIYKTSVVQPFNVVSQSPVYAARHYIDPFLQAIRSQGATMDNGFGGFGIVSPEVIRTIGIGGFGADPNTPVPYDQYAAVVAAAERAGRAKWYFLAAGVLGGVAAGFLAARAMR